MCDQPQARQRYRSAKRRSLTGYSSPSYSAMNTTSSMLRGNVSPEVGERGPAAVYVTDSICLIICLVSRNLKSIVLLLARIGHTQLCSFTNMPYLGNF